MNPIVFVAAIHSKTPPDEMLLDATRYGAEVEIDYDLGVTRFTWRAPYDRVDCSRFMAEWRKIRVLLHQKAALGIECIYRAPRAPRQLPASRLEQNHGTPDLHGRASG